MKGRAKINSRPKYGNRGSTEIKITSLKRKVDKILHIIETLENQNESGIIQQQYTIKTNQIGEM